MKNLICVLLLQLLYIFDVSCNENILSKFHQNSFKIRDFRGELISYDENYYNFFEIKTFKYNRTTPAVNATFRLKVSPKDKAEVVVQALKFMSNEYRHFPVRFQVNLQKAFQADAIGLQGMKNCGNLTSFYFAKDVTYHICNFVLDATKFPPLIPNGRYKIDLKMLYLNKEVSFICMYLEIYTPIEYPKN